MHLSHRTGAARGTEGAELAHGARPGRENHAGAVRPGARPFDRLRTGFSLHAGVRCGAHQRKELERLCRYITRPAIANERLKRNGEGQVVLQLKSAYRDGTTHIVMSPLEFMQRLAALVPRPRLLKRVFDIDVEHCPQCGGDLKIIAAIEEPAVIVRILTHLGLPARAPPRAPARPLALFRAA